MKGQTNPFILQNRLQRQLRRNMTDAEQRLWRRLRQRQVTGFRFRRQHPFADYVLDFVCLEAGLVIEVDGGQHTAMTEEDRERTLMLERAGFRVLRFWNHEVLQDLDAVMEAIWGALQPPPPSRPSPRIESGAGSEGEGAKQRC